MGTLASIDAARRKRAIRRFCNECKTPWSLTGIQRDGGFIVICKHCGHVRASVPVQRRALHDT